MFARQVGSVTKPIPFLMVSNIGHISGALHLSPKVMISKNCSAFMPVYGGVFEIGFGWYGLSGNVNDRDTLGDLVIHAEAPTADMTDEKGIITSFDPFTTPNGDPNTDEVNILTNIYSVLKNINNYSVPIQGVIP